MAKAFLQSAVDATNATIYTFADQNVGGAAADRYILVCIEARAVGTTAVTSTVTVEGGNADLVVQRQRTSLNSSYAGMFLAPLASGTDADIVVTFSREQVRAVINLYRLDSLASATASDTDSFAGSTDPAMTLDVPDDGTAIACSCDGSTTAVAATGLTEDDDAVAEAAMRYVCSSDDFPDGSVGLAVGFNYTSPSGEVAAACASWAYGAAPPATGRVMFPPNLGGTGRGGVFPGNRLS